MDWFIGLIIGLIAGLLLGEWSRTWEINIRVTDESSYFFNKVGKIFKESVYEDRTRCYSLDMKDCLTYWYTEDQLERV